MTKMHIIKPLITEKGISAAQRGVYSFKVSISTRKKQISEEIEKLFNVKVKKIRTYIRAGKVIRRGKRMVPKRKGDEKIAYVTLSKGKIDLFSQS